MEHTLNRVALALESIAASLQDIAAHGRGQLTMDLHNSPTIVPEEPVANLKVNLREVKSMGLFEGLEDEQRWAPSPAELVPPTTREEVLDALGNVARKHGPEAGKRILASFGVAKLSELPADKYRAVVQACGAVG